MDRTAPVRTGQSIKLYCTSEGGDPAPSISWRRGGVPLPAAGQDVDNVSGRVTSSVVISNLSQQDQGALVRSKALKRR